MYIQYSIFLFCACAFETQTYPLIAPVTSPDTVVSAVLGLCHLQFLIFNLTALEAGQ